jgi:large subunit ribosomal protein L32
MAVPKKRKSKQKSRQGKAGRPKLQLQKPSACPNCGSPRLSHQACGSCGYYNGRVHSLTAHGGTKEETAEA